VKRAAVPGLLTGTAPTPVGRKLGIRGTHRLGDAPLFPAPTDPDVGYGPSPTQIRIRPYGLAEPGFAYAVENAQVVEARLQLSVPTADPYRAWCELQTPFLVDLSGASMDFYACLPGDGIPFDSESLDPDNQQCTYQWSKADGTLESNAVDCGKYALCGSGWSFGACSCSATACTVHSEAFSSATLDGAIQDGGARLTGSLVLADYRRVTVRLHRQ
jgi:hypothetical protein